MIEQYDRQQSGEWTPSTTSTEPESKAPPRAATPQHRDYIPPDLLKSSDALFSSQPAIVRNVSPPRPHTAANDSAHSPTGPSRAPHRVGWPQNTPQHENHRLAFLFLSGTSDETVATPLNI